MLGELALRYPLGGDITAQQASARLRLLAEDLSDALDGDACRAAIKAGVRTWRFLPTCAEIVEASHEFAAERRAKSKQERLQREAADRVALPPLEYVDPSDIEAIKARCFAELDVGYQRMEGRPMPGSRQRSNAVPANVSTALRMPTTAELAEIAALLAAKPSRKRDEWTNADDAMMRSAAA